MEKLATNLSVKMKMSINPGAKPKEEKIDLSKLQHLKNPYQLERSKLYKYCQELMVRVKGQTVERIKEELEERERSRRERGKGPHDGDGEGGLPESDDSKS